MITCADTPLVTIIMLAYNRETFIAEAIEAIINQTYKNWELIIIDNGSTDNTSTIIKLYSDHRIIHESYTQNRFTGTVRNIAIRKASGELIAFADDDDIWMTDKLEKQVHQLLQYPEAGFCYTNGYNFSKDSIQNLFLHKTNGIECDSIFIPYCKGECGIFLQTILVWRENIITAGLFEENRTFADFKFIGNLTYHFKSVILYEPLIKRRIHPSNSIYTYGRELSNEYVESLEFYLKNNMLNSDVYSKGLFKYYVNGITTSENISGRWGHFFNAIRIKPFSLIPFKKIIKSTLRL